MGSVPGWGAKISYASQPKKNTPKQNRSNIVTNSIKSLKMVHMEKKKRRSPQSEVERRREGIVEAEKRLVSDCW